MRALDRKLLRDLLRMRGQVGAIALVIASGAAVLIMSLTAIEALDETTAAYYERNRFAQVFAGVKRAPERLAGRIAALPGVQSVETRIVKLANLDIDGFKEPVVGQLVSIPESREPLLNRLALRAGRRVAVGRPDEVVISEPFAEAHGLTLGTQLSALVNGRKRRLQVVGIALSPEYVYAIGPGALMPDDKRYGILWMGREALAAAFDLDGAFNEVSLSLLRGARSAEVIDRLDRLLARFGGIGAYDRSDQISAWFLSNEIEQLKTMARILPTIFLAVAAFLANMALARLIAVERSEIGLLKAFGYTDLAIGWHYLKLAAAMTLPGILLGWALGYWLGRINTEQYAEFFRFPFLLFQPSLGPFAAAALVSLAAVLIGAVMAVRAAVALPAAEAMRPPAPPAYSRTRFGTALFAWCDQPTRVILRHTLRWPLRAFMTASGIATAVAVLVISLQWFDAINHIVETYFHQAQRQDVTVALVEAQSSEALRGLERLPGVLAVEPIRTVRARLWAGNRSRLEAIQGVPAVPRLNLVYGLASKKWRAPTETGGVRWDEGSGLRRSSSARRCAWL